MTGSKGITETKMSIYHEILNKKEEKVKYRCILKSKYVLSKILGTESPCPIAKNCTKERYGDPKTESTCVFVVKYNNRPKEKRQKGLQKILQKASMFLF